YRQCGVPRRGDRESRRFPRSNKQSALAGTCPSIKLRRFDFLPDFPWAGRSIPPLPSEITLASNVRERQVRDRTEFRASEISSADSYFCCGIRDWPSSCNVSYRRVNSSEWQTIKCPRAKQPDAIATQDGRASGELLRVGTHSPF